MQIFNNYSGFILSPGVKCYGFYYFLRRIMKEEIIQMNLIWDKMLKERRDISSPANINFNDIVSETFAIGPLYYYIIDTYDFSISHISNGFKKAHGFDPDHIKTINDILYLIHPEDIMTVTKAEEMAFAFMNNVIGIDKIKEYKFSYNFRFKTLSGEYQLFNHQSLVLTTEEKVKSLNIHTNIDHLTKTNNKKLSLIGLAGQPSFLNMDICETENENSAEVIPLKKFSKRELQIIKLIAEGLDTNEIAEQLFISTLTVKTHRKNILHKSGCKNSIELVSRGISEGWI